MAIDPLTAAVRRALRDAPCSLRALAREAGVSHSTLVLINGGSLDASLAIADALTVALRTWGERCTKLADAVEQAARSRKKEG